MPLDDGAVVRTIVSLTLRQAVFLEMSPADKIEWLERKILHRQNMTKMSQEWIRVVRDTTKEGAVNVKNVITYTKTLVRSVKQRMRVLYAQIKKEFKADPDILEYVPYPGDEYDPTANEFDVDFELDDEEHPHADIWSYLVDARKGLCDGKLITVYGAPGVQWPQLVGATDSLEAYPAYLRTLIKKLDKDLQGYRDVAAAMRKKEKAEKEKARLTTLRVKVTLTTTAPSEYDYDTNPLYLSPSWHNCPDPDTNKPLKEGWRVCGVGGLGKVEFDDVPLGKQNCVIFASNVDKKTLLKIKNDTVVVRVHLALEEADVETGKVIDITPLLLHLPGFEKAAGDKADDNGDVFLDVSGLGEEGPDDAPSSGPELDSDAEREKDAGFTVEDDTHVKKGAPPVQKGFTRTHAHEIDCSKPFPIDPLHLTQSQVAMQLDSRIKFLNADAHDVLSNGSDVMFAGRDSTEKVLHPSIHQILADCLFADSPFGWFTYLYHDVPWSKEYWQRLCVAAFGALVANGVFVIRYGGWLVTEIYQALKDAGFTIPMKQSKLHIQEASLVNRKSHNVCGRGHVNGHFQIIVAYKSNDSKNQHFDNDNWMLRSNKFRSISSITAGIPAVPYNRKVTVDGQVVRMQQMSLVEAVEIVHRYCRPSGVFMDICCGTGRTALACIVLGRQCIMNDRDPLAIDVAARDSLGFMQFLFNQGRLAQIGGNPTWRGVDPFTRYFSSCDGKPVRLDEHGVPKVNTPLGWPKKGGEEEVNKFLEPGGFKVSGDKLQAISEVRGVVPGGVFGNYLRRLKPPKKVVELRTPYCVLNDSGITGLKIYPTCPLVSSS